MFLMKALSQDWYQLSYNIEKSEVLIIWASFFTLSYSHIWLVGCGYGEFLNKSSTF